MTKEELKELEDFIFGDNKEVDIKTYNVMEELAECRNKIRKLEMKNDRYIQLNVELSNALDDSLHKLNKVREYIDNFYPELKKDNLDELIKIINTTKE